MQLRNLKEFDRGWIIGEFFPRVEKADVELGIHRYKKGDKRKKHYHKEFKEVNVVVSGKCELIFHHQNDMTLVGVPDTIFVIDPYEVTSFKALEDCTIVCFKTGSNPKDKFLV